VFRSFFAALLTAAVLTAAGCALIPGPGKTEDGSSSPEKPGGGFFSRNEKEDRSDTGGGDENDAPDPVLSGNPLSCFGLTMDQIRAALGEPNDQGVFEGADYFSYYDQGMALFFWASEDEDTQVRSIQLFEGTEVAGIKVGMTFAEIKAVLGPPLLEGYSEYEEAYSLVCDYGQFRLFFTADSAVGPTASVRIKYIIDT
jgi:hypothetical protein